MGFWPSTLGPSDFQEKPVGEREAEQERPREAGEPAATQTTGSPVEGENGTVRSQADETPMVENTE